MSALLISLKQAVSRLYSNPFYISTISGINYFHCREIVEILRETEKDTKNLFGHYSSQRMKDWQVSFSVAARSTSEDELKVDKLLFIHAVDRICL